MVGDELRLASPMTLLLTTVSDSCSVFHRLEIPLCYLPEHLCLHNTLPEGAMPRPCRKRRGLTSFFMASAIVLMHEESLICFRTAVFDLRDFVITIVACVCCSAMPIVGKSKHIILYTC